VVLIEPVMHGDHRGFFLETYHQRKLQAAGLEVEFVQDNLSRSRRGILRGLHYQIQQPQGKYVCAMRGEIFDVAVDLRRSSPTFGRWVGARLDEDSRRTIYVPPGFAHGFYVLSETADVFYKCTEFYAPEYERTLRWNDPDVAIDWPLVETPTLSHKDQHGQWLCEAECFP
jgi:dTDP-4-dehydrorhamnose 3,5-epimerase